MLGSQFDSGGWGGRARLNLPWTVRGEESPSGPISKR